MVNDSNGQSIEICLSVARGSQMSTKREVWLALVVATMTVHSFVKRLFWLANILHTTSTLKEVYNILGFASYIAKYGVFCASGVTVKSLGIQYLFASQTSFVSVATTNASQTSLSVDIWDPLATLRQISIDWPLKSLTTTMLGLRRIDLLWKDFESEN